MIGWLNGYIIDKIQPGKLVINVNGVGYDVETSLPTFFKSETIDGLVGLHIHTIVREDALLLYGFLERKERELFRCLIKVNGIGPKVALSVLSNTTPEELIHCIQEKNSSLLMKLPGIGKKTAERLIIEMQDSLSQYFMVTTESSHTLFNKMSSLDEAVCALEALGYKSQEALKVVKKINDGSKSCEQLIRESLQILAAR